METQTQTQTQTPPKIQHVTKASSDKILRKFAQVDSDSDTEKTGPVTRKSTSKRPRLGRKKKGGIVSNTDSIEEEENSPPKENINININMNINQSGSLLRKVEKKSLLPLNNNRRSSSSSSSGTMIRKFGISKSHYSRGFRHKSVLGAIEKTWSKAIRGASKVFMEKHYNRHRILNSDFV